MTDLAPLHVWFVGGQSGAWRVGRINVVAGRPLTAVDQIAVLHGQEPPPLQGSA